jgi:hypothetical protein
VVTDQPEYRQQCEKTKEVIDNNPVIDKRARRRASTTHPVDRGAAEQQESARCADTPDKNDPDLILLAK